MGSSTESNKRNIFAPLPARAIADEVLTALDLRVLACLAAHDRFGANGVGCYASHPRLAELVKCHLKSLSRSLRVLADNGYIEVGLHPLNKRLRVYRVVYNADDKAVMKQRIGNQPVTDKDPVEDPTGNEPVPEDEPIGNQHFQKGEQYQSDADVNIFSEAGRYPAEAVKDNSPEGAPPYGDAKDLPRNEESEHNRSTTTGNLLGRTQTWLKSLEGERLTEGQIDELHEKRKFCEEVEEQHGLEDIGPWAQRLAIDIDILLEKPDDEDAEPFFPEDRAVNGRVFTTTKTTGEGELIGEPRNFTATIGGRAARGGRS